MLFESMKSGSGNIYHSLTELRVRLQSAAIAAKNGNTVNEELMRERLLALRDELQAAAETAEGSAAIVELDQSKVGRLSRMDAMQAQAMAQASGNRRDATLRRITAALQRIDDGEYGICPECDEPINPKRLDFDPTVLLCIDCASELENG